MENQQLIITLDRQFGSGGRDIAHFLGDRLGIPVYHHSLLKKIGINEGYDLDEVRDMFDETPKVVGVSRTVRGVSNSNRDFITHEEFKWLKKMADDGKSFIVIGHCADYILRKYPIIKVFICGDKQMRIERTMETFGIDAKEAKKMMKKKDTERKKYHNHYSKSKTWSDAREYDLCLNSTRLGIHKSVDFLQDYIDRRLKEMKQD